METLEYIKKRSARGVFALSGRTAFIQLISLAGTFYLTYFLTPEVFGLFYIVSAVVAFLGYFSDIGLAASLIQKKEDITDKDLITTFTIQQLIVVIICAVSVALSPYISWLYGLNAGGEFLLTMLIISFFLASLKTIPSVLLERKLQFEKLAIPAIFETIVFYGISTYFASQGFGIYSFAYAVIVRGIVGVLVIYWICPWTPRVGIYASSARSLLSFGVPFQLNSVLALVKDDLFTLYLGKVLPFAEVGYIGWAKRWAEALLRLIMDSIIKVTFPTYARLQYYPDKLAKGIEKSLFFIHLLLLPASVGMILFIDPIISFIPKYAKWEPAISSFQIFVLVSAVAAISTPLINALNAIGKIRISLYFMVLWTVLTWSLAPLMINIFGFRGYALSQLIIAVTVFLVIIVSKRYIAFSLLPTLAPSLVSSMSMAVILGIMKTFMPVSIVSLIALGVTGVGIYLVVLYLFYYKKVREEILGLVRLFIT